MKRHQKSWKFYTSPIWIFIFLWGLLFSIVTLYHVGFQENPQIAIVLTLPRFVLIGGHGSYTFKRSAIYSSRVWGLYRASLSLKSVRYIEITNVRGRWELRSFYHHYPGCQRLSIDSSETKARELLQKLMEWNILIHDPNHHFPNLT